MSLELPFGIKVLNPEPLDSYLGPHASIAAANAAIPAAIRYQGMITFVVIAGSSYVYHYKDGIADMNLVLLEQGSGTTPITELVVDVSGSIVNLDLLSPTNIVHFLSSGTIDEEKEWQINNIGGSKAFTFLFELSGLYNQQLPENSLVSGNLWNPNTGQWEPAEAGVYKATFTKLSSSWLVDINGPYAGVNEEILMGNTDVLWGNTDITFED